MTPTTDTHTNKQLTVTLKKEFPDIYSLKYVVIFFDLVWSLIFNTLHKDFSYAA
jgi:hypothetical protein